MGPIELRKAPETPGTLTRLTTAQFQNTAVRRNANIVRAAALGALALVSAAAPIAATQHDLAQFGTMADNRSR